MGKDYSQSDLVQRYLTAAKNAGMAEPTDRLIGNNGYELGQEFHATGELKVVENEINGRSTAYVAVVTTEGVELSIRSLMNVSSLRGYETSGTFISEYDNDDGEKKERELTASVVKGFDGKQVTQPSNRRLLSFIAECEESKYFEGKTIKYLGNVVRPYKATRPSPDTSFEQWQEGYQRAINVNLWNIK